MSGASALELRLPNEGVAAVYVSVPLGRFQREWSNIGTAINAANRGFISAPEILYLTGQADLAARVVVSDFRAVVDLAYPDVNSHALIYNWVFSVPYRVTASADDGSGDDAVTRDDSYRIRFLTHLRVRRGIYSEQPAETEAAIVAKLAQLTTGDGISANVEVGLGWSDLIVDCAVQEAAFTKYLQILVNINALHVGNGTPGDAIPVFERTLTLIGYPWTPQHADAPAIEGVQPLIFLRSAPGRLREVEALLKNSFRGASIHIVDGKADVVAIVPKPEPQFLLAHEMLAEDTGRRVIQKLETHLLFTDSYPAESEGEVDVSPGVDVGPPMIPLMGARVRDCKCRHTRAPIQLDFVPTELQHAIRNLGFLFTSTQLDSTNCCDARGAIVACEESLRRLIRSLRSLHVETRDTDDQANRMRFIPAPVDARVRELNENIIEQQRTIEQWVLTSERVLRQRTIGSFEEFLGQSDRAVVYRGGVQKLLFLADNLMNDFYREVVNLDRSYPFFATMYDSVGTILSVVGTGLVRIPARHLFSLAAVIPDLWHEVGVYRFFQIFRFSDFGLTHAHSKDMFRYRDLADLYGDILVLFYGFRCEFDHFVVSVIQGWIDSQPHAHVPELARQWNYAQVLSRLVLSLEFLFSRLAPDLAIRGREVVVPEIYDHVTAMITHYFPSAPVKPTALTKARVLRYVLADWAGESLKMLTADFTKDDVSDAMAKRESARERSETVGVLLKEDTIPLASFTPDTDLNEEFRHLYWHLQISRRVSEKSDRANAFGAMAALGRGAAIEYFRRLMVAEKGP